MRSKLKDIWIDLNFPSKFTLRIGGQECDEQQGNAGEEKAGDLKFLPPEVIERENEEDNCGNFNEAGENETEIEVARDHARIQRNTVVEKRAHGPEIESTWK